MFFSALQDYLGQLFRPYSYLMALDTQKSRNEKAICTHPHWLISWFKQLVRAFGFHFHNLGGITFLLINQGSWWSRSWAGLFKLDPNNWSGSHQRQCHFLVWSNTCHTMVSISCLVAVGPIYNVFQIQRFLWSWSCWSIHASPGLWVQRAISSPIFKCFFMAITNGGNCTALCLLHMKETGI